ncbi:MAG: FadR/GntR family transcriptional regulator, partial [Paracoccus sp. (in: a-proteobacteria)]
HLAIAKATKNAFFHDVLQSLGRQIGFGMKLSRSLTLLADPARQQLVQDEHRAVIDAIRNQQPERASEALRHHITAARDRMFVGTT